MEEKRYLISDAAKLTEVEAHVLRYWEEELDLVIGRTELGHRYYTRENLKTFQRIKELKEEGLQLKAIREVLKEEEKNPLKDPDADRGWRGDTGAEPPTMQSGESGIYREQAAQTGMKSVPSGATGDCWKQTGDARMETDPPGKYTDIDGQALPALKENTEKLRHFEKLVSEIVDRVVRENNEELGRRIEEAFSKETEELIRMQELQEEARFRRLDEVIRMHQLAGREAAAAQEGGFLRRWFRRWLDL